MSCLFSAQKPLFLLSFPSSLNYDASRYPEEAEINLLFTDKEKVWVLWLIILLRLSYYNIALRVLDCLDCIISKAHTKIVYSSPLKVSTCHRCGRSCSLSTVKNCPDSNKG